MLEQMIFLLLSCIDYICMYSVALVVYIFSPDKGCCIENLEELNISNEKIIKKDKKIYYRRR